MNPILSHGLMGLCALIIGICIGYSLRDKGKFNSAFILQWGVGLISLLALTGLFVSINQYRDATTCQSVYNTNFTRSLKERADASNSDRDAIVKMLNIILNPGSSVDQRRTAVEEWRTSLQNADKQRAANPLPIIPDCAKEN